MKLRSLLCALAVLTIAFFSAFSASAAIQFPRSTFDNLDYGIYWFGSGDQLEKAVAGRRNAYFDPTRPTLIYVHGWQSGSTKLLKREVFNYVDSGSPDLYLVDIWRNAGWNVGIMYWNQFADELLVADAEAKIWSADGPRKMRWVNAAGAYSEGPARPASALFYESYKSAMEGYQGSNIRIAGHSLGNQMAIAVTKLISDGVTSGEIPSRLLPKRVALLDPAYTSGGKGYLGGAWTGARARGHVAELIRKGIVFEAYRSSSIGFGFGPLLDENLELYRQIAVTDLKPAFASPLDVATRHSVAIWSYFWSMAFSVPRVNGTSRRGLSASTPDGDLAAWMSSPEKQVHSLGIWTKTPEDDVMEVGAK